MEVFCTICSKEKDRNIELLPAIDRYISNRINSVEELASRNRNDFYILSGKFGLVHKDELVPHYDRLLGNDDVGQMVTLVSKQLKRYGIAKLVFFGKDVDKHPNWLPYVDVVNLATQNSTVTLEMRLIA